MRKIIIDQDVFVKFPDFKRGIIIVEEIENKLESRDIALLLADEINNRSDCDLNGDFITAWDEVHLQFGSNPNKFPPSMKSLIKRIQKGGGFPFINSVVALFNYISIKHLVPCGGDDLETIKGNLRLGFAKGNEIFIPLGGDKSDPPEIGEIIYFDDQNLNVMCRRWNWRNGDFSKITENTKKMVINIDGIGLADRKLIEEARDELAGLLIKHCGAKLKTDCLDRDKNEIALDF